MSRPALFFDRDGTLCREVGYVNHPDRLALMPDTAEVLRRVGARGWATVVVTNQAGAARGYFPFHRIDDTHRRLRDLLEASGAAVDGIYYCPHHPDVGPPGLHRRCDCRKPGPGMLLQAARDLDLDLQRSWIVGDSFRDVGAGRNAGLAGTVLLRTGYGRGELIKNAARADIWPDRVADSLTDAVEYVFAHTGEIGR